MRISTRLYYDRSTQSILEQQSKLSKSELHLASGLRILTPSDDPAGAAGVLSLNRVSETIEQFQDNSRVLRGRLETEEVTLETAANIMQRANELALQGSSGTYSAEQRSMLAVEAEELLQGLLGTANMRDSNGEYIYSGFQRDTRPFTDLGGGSFQYNGDQGQRFLRISDDWQVLDNETGMEVFLDIQASGGGLQSAFTTLYNLADDLRNNIPPSASVADTQAAMEKFVEIRAKVGSRLKALDTQNAANESFLITAKTQVSEIRDLDYATAITQLNTDMVALQSAQQAYIKLQGLSLFNYM